MSEEKRKYTIEEIVYYLKGCLIGRYLGRLSNDNTTNLTENSSLKNAINEIEDFEDGIDAVLIRKAEFENKKYNVQTN